MKKIPQASAASVYVLTRLVGRWRWEPAPWMTWLAARAAALRRALTASPIRAAAVLAVLLAALGVVRWYVNRPKPHYVTWSIAPPPLTEYNDKGIVRIHPLTIDFSESAAPLKQVEKVVPAGIDLAPAVGGSWFWTSDRQLTFTPKDDWPVGAAFTVRMAKNGLLAGGVLLERYRGDFESPPFSAVIASSEFYQDPNDPALKKLVATLRFSHPVDAARLESRVSLAVAKDAEYLGLKRDSRRFTIAYDTFKLAAFIHSAALAVPRDDTPMTLAIAKGVRAARGGNETRAMLESIVTIPGRSSLRFAEAHMAVVDNARYEPEQILMLASSAPVPERALAGAVSLRLLPVRHPRQPKEQTGPYEWGDPAQVGADVLTRSEPLRLSYVASEEGGSTTHGFKFTAPVGRYLHVLVKDGVEAAGGYISAKPFAATVKVEPYRRALTFLGEGALLSLSGDRKIGFLSRDVDRVEVEIGRVLPNQLHHLAPQMRDFSRPDLYGHLEDRLVERMTEVRDYRGRAPGKPTYDSIDVGRYLDDRSGARRGLFVLHVRAARAPRVPAARDEAGEGEEGEESDSEGDQLEDTRLVLVTDLGFIVKQATDGARDVFVQSIRTGLPVEGAAIELVGANGQPVLTATTDATGRAALPRLSPREASRERTPRLILARKDADLSFLPFASRGRQLDFSRFETGGIDNADSPQQISAYLFSDRGIYRPGETTHLGLIARTADWKTSLAGLPIVVEITDPRGLVVGRRDLALSAAAFDEIDYASQPTSPTGIYQAAAYLVKNERRRETLGSTSFRLQEFEPDRLKVQLELGALATDGWLDPGDVKPRLTVAHLFGLPAGNRRVEGDLSLTPALPRFARYPDYRFQIGETLPEPYQETLAAGTTDQEGHAGFSLDLQRFVGRAYRLNVLARAFEAEGGRNVAVQASAIVSAAPYLVGVKADGDLSFVQRNSAREARWLAVNRQLSPVAADALSLEWVQRKYVSVLTRQDNGTFRYVSRLKDTVRETKAIRIASGGTRLPLPTREPGDFVLVLRNGSGVELNRLAYTVAGEANLSRSLERNAELQVHLDKPAYRGGDTIAVGIRAPYVGAGLITIERDRVFHHHWFKTTTTSSVQRVRLPGDFEGNGYVTVQFLRDPASDEIFMSPLSYGVAPFAPDLTARRQSIALVVPKQVKPGETLVMRLTPAERSRVAVLAVDEGILQVARYRNPDPLGFFFQKRRLQVETREILDLILPDFKRFVALAAAGGDADGGFARHLNPFNRKRRPPVAYWSGVVDVGVAGRELQYPVPDAFNGRLRIVAIGISPGRMGVIDAGVEVRGDFILTPNVPAMAAPGDEFQVSVGVFNNTTGGSGPIQLEARVPAGLTLVGPSSVELQIPDKREGVAEFRLRTNPVLGGATITFVARRGAAESRLDESVSVRPAVAYRTSLTLGRVDGASSVAALTRDLYAERRKVDASISSVPLVWGQGLTTYLEHYEYSCTEQLASKGIAALLLTARPELGTAISGPGRPLPDAWFGQLLAVLRSRQNDEGGFGLWASTPYTAEFASVYAAHLLVEAKDRGQKVPVDVLTSLDSWLTRFAATPAGTLPDARLRAYAVYLLVRQGIKPDAALANVEQELTHRHGDAWPTDLAAAYLASTYRLMQRNDDADRIMSKVPWSFAAKRPLGDTVYYDPLVHDAELLYLMARHFPARLGGAIPAIEAIGSAVSGNRAHSLSAAYTLLALDAYAKTAASSGQLGIAEIDSDGLERALALPVSAIPRVAIAQTAARVRFSKGGPAPAYFALVESGFDRVPPAAEVSRGIEIVREFIDTNGKPLARAVVGQEFFVRLRLRAAARDVVPEVAVVDLLPGGVEPVLELRPPADSSTGPAEPGRYRSSPGEDPAAMRQVGAAAALPIGVPGYSDWSPSHVDVREDRVVFYGTVTRQVKTFTYRVRATNAGTFQTPPAFAEGMYDRAMTGLSPSVRLEIVKP